MYPQKLMCSLNVNELLVIRRELLNAVDNKNSTKQDLMNTMEEVSKKLLQMYTKSK